MKFFTKKPYFLSFSQFEEKQKDYEFIERLRKWS